MMEYFFTLHLICYFTINNYSGYKYRRKIKFQMQTNDISQMKFKMELEEENRAVKHETWGRKLDFLICAMGLSIGMGNVWRFPYLCYKHGGGAFLIAYFSSAIICGIPTFYMECFLGQITRRSAYIAWKFCPILEGLGIGFLMVNLYLGVYLVVIMSWVFHFLGSSFISPLPWTYCDPKWATNRCLTNFSEVLNNKSYYTDPVNEYFRNHVLRLTPTIDNVGGINGPLAGCMFAACFICFFVIWKGIKISGKIMYFTALAPFLLIIILLGKSCSLKGSINGIKYYLSPDFKKLSTYEVWADAGAQIFYSYGLASGVLTSLASHNKLDHNVYLDSIRCSVVNSFCSLLAGFVIFPVLGFMANRQNVPITEVTKSGPSLAFIAYPRALAELTGPNVWSFLFFLALIFIGIDSSFITLETSVLSIEDILEGRVKVKYQKEIISFSVCFGTFLFGLAMVTNGGMYVFQIINYFPISQVLILTGFLEGIAVTWIYGYERFQNDLKILGLKTQGKIFKFLFVVLTPIFGFTIFIMNSLSSITVSYNGYIFPPWATVVGWLLTCTIILPIIGVAIYNYYMLDEPNYYKRFLLMFKCKSLINDKIMTCVQNQKNSDTKSETV